MDKQESDGRCASCGFLSQFDAHLDGPPPHLYEYPSRDREQGGPTVVRLAKDRLIYTFPRCYRNCLDIFQEISMLEKDGTSSVLATLEVLKEDRQCQKWHPYTPGFSPQEHLEDIRMQELELARRKFEDKMNQSNRNFQVFLTVVVLIFALAEIVTTMAFPAGWPWLMSKVGSLPPPPSVPMIPGGF